MSKTIIIIMNFFVPGAGTIFTGKILQAIIQLLLTVIAWAFYFSFFLAFIGLILFGISWIWALVIGLNHNSAVPAPTGIQRSRPSGGIGKKI